MHLVGVVRSNWVTRVALLLAAFVCGIAIAGTVTYTVDPASGRVTKATYPDGSYITYSYDANGNRISAVVTSAADTTAPSAPGTPTFSAITATTATVSWTAASDNVGVTAYEYSRNGGSTWTSVGNALSASLTGLTGSTTYTVQVRAKDAAGNTGSSSSASFTTSDTTAPSAPGTPTFTSITATSATMSWSAATDNVGVASYEYSRNGGSTWTNVGNVLTTSLTGLSGSTTYTVQVRAKDAANNTGTASSGSFTTSDVTAPTAPGAPTFTAITSTSATANWTAATDNIGVTSYEWSRNGGSTWTNVGNVRTANITGLTGSTSYTILVHAKDAANNVGPNSSASFTTLAASDTTAPSAPGTPTIGSITATTATASWAAATDNVGVASYEYSLNGGSSWTNVGNVLSVGLTGLTNGTNYTFQVRAKDAANNTGSPSSRTFSTTDTTAPGAPGTPTVSSITATTATATWTAATDNVGVTAYEYSLNGGAWTGNGTSLSVNLIGLTNGTVYTIQVRAKDAAGNTGSASSKPFSTLDTTAPTAPGTPTFSSITETSAVATWTAASDNVGVTAYEYSKNGGAWTSNGSATSVTLTGLSAGTNYTLQVRAKDAAGNTGSPSSGSFKSADTTAPSAPGTPAFSSVTASSATASWSAASDNVGVLSYDYSLNGAAWVGNGTGLSVNLTGLSQATSYSFRVLARDAAGNLSSISTNSFSTPDVSAPTAPGTPGFSSITSTSAVASWAAASDNVGVTGYDYSLNGGAWTSTGSASPSVTLTSLTSSTNYTLAVRARDAAGNAGSSSGTGSFMTSDVTPPTAPGTPGFSSITVTSAVASWSAASDNIAVQRYEYSLNGGASWTSVGSALSVSLTGLSSYTSYTVSVRAVDTSGNAGSSSSNSFRTLDGTAPSAPGTPTFSSVTGTSATASWTAASDNVGIARYEYSFNGGSWTSVGTALSVSFSGLTVGNTYTVQVRAIDTSENASAASSGSFTTIATIVMPNTGFSTVGMGGTTATFQLAASGDYLESQPSNPNQVVVGAWLSPKVGMSGFQVYVTSTTPCPVGTYNQWLDMSTSRIYQITVVGSRGAIQNCSVDMQFRHSSNPSVILGNAHVTVTAVGQ